MLALPATAQNYSAILAPGGLGGLNDAGTVVGGYGAGNGSAHAFMQKGGSLVDLGTLPGGSNSFARWINTDENTVGYSDNPSGEYHAALWSGGSIVDLGTLPGDIQSFANAINNKDQIAGTSVGADGSHHGFLYENGAMRPLGTLGGSESAALGINDDGIVVGWSTGSDGVQHPFRWSTATGMVQLTAASGSAYAINGHGQVVGEAGERAALWDSDGVLTDLGAAIGGDESAAYGINDAGQVVGRVGVIIYASPDAPYPMEDYVDYAAVLWDSAHGAGYLASLVTGGDQVGGLVSGDVINNNSQIVAEGWYGNFYLLSLSDAPSPPTIMTASALSDNRIQLSWTQPYRAATFNVKISTYSGGPYTTVATGVSSTTFVDTGLTAGTTYYFVVSGVSATGSEGYNSNEVYATAAVVTPPMGLNAAGGKHKISLAWTQSNASGVTKNRIYRRSSPSSSYALLATIPAGTSYADASAQAKSTYWYVVTAVRSNGSESPYSNEAYSTSK
jgi:probable HAF family extracellular repeat protein